ncbi:DinB family protein [Aequorivita todarodis]|uniref:DinB family protein n=1 Tax=Aequorivita todarodis TaxID=2036821 RepID=UPI0023509E0A|nr:DinB family protein [Aequorivita todarodis]MDC7999810.1 DinB family protein [Aequorivita todarodis]
MLPTAISPSEYNPYYGHYIGLVENINLMDALSEGLNATHGFFEGIPPNKWNHQYAAGKWTPKDILQHIADTERVFAYRALYFARSNNAELKGFDENIFAENALAGTKTVADLLQNYVAVRNATLNLFKNFDESQLKQKGRANGSDMSVRAAGFVICGHEIHHCNILRERYL